MSGANVKSCLLGVLVRVSNAVIKYLDQKQPMEGRVCSACNSEVTLYPEKLGTQGKTLGAGN